jgi:hypothetical protein
MGDATDKIGMNGQYRGQQCFHIFLLRLPPSIKICCNTFCKKITTDIIDPAL